MYRGKMLGKVGAGLLVAAALAGCGGQSAAGNHDAGDSVAGSGSSTPADPGGTGGSGGTAANGESNTGAVGGRDPNALVECAAANLFASADVSDDLGVTEQGTNGKVRVTVTKLEEGRPSALEAPANLSARHYVLKGDSKEWQLDVTIPSLESELIQVGDELDFQLETSLGFIPFTHAVNQVFGLFAPDGGLLVFGAKMTGFAPLPELSFLGLEVSDGGVACGRTPNAGVGCHYQVHSAHFISPQAQLDLAPGETGQLGQLVIGVQDYAAIRSGSNSGACEDTGRSLMVGAKTPPKSAK